MTWDYTNKNTSSWNYQSKSGVSIDYMAGKVGYGEVGKARIGATTDGTISGS